MDQEKAGDKSTDVDSKEYVPWGVTTFAGLDAHREALAQTISLQDLVYDFRGLMENVMESNEIDVLSKATAIADLAGDFRQRVSQALAKERCEVHYAEVEKDCTKARADEFAGGCRVCGFGEKDTIKAFGRCPFCGVDYAQTTDG